MHDLALGAFDAGNLLESGDPSILPSDIHSDEIHGHVRHAASDREAKIGDRPLCDIARNVVFEGDDDLSIFIMLLGHDPHQVWFPGSV